MFRGMHYRAVTKASTRLETEMTKDKGLRNLVKEILSNINRLTENSIFVHHCSANYLILLTSI